MQNNLFQVTGRSLFYELPHGAKLLNDISFTWNFRRCALVGPNGVGKTTLAKILAGILEPKSGELRCSQSVVYLAQVSEPADITVGEYLIGLWESPVADPAVWGLLLQDIPLEQNLKSLSGGQWTRVRIAEALGRGGGLLILDEPTNNLDREARELVYRFVREYPGCLLLISHDRELLEEVDGIWELSSQGLSSYGGSYSFYEEQKQAERELLEEKIDRARREKKKLEREHHDKLQSQEKRMRQGDAKAAKGGIPRIIVGGLKRRAQETHARINVNEEKRVEKSQENLRELVQAQKLESRLGLDLSAAALPEGKLVFELDQFNLSYSSEGSFLWEEALTCTMRGPRRWALYGVNGAGKTSLLDCLLSRSQAVRTAGVCRLGEVPVQVLDQNYSQLSADQSVLENVMEKSRFDLVETRNRLAQFQFFGDMVHRKTGDLSGGEKLKASLAKLLMSQPVPQLLILDEPTNNLDLASLKVLEMALMEYAGALLVVSHDEVFLQNIGVEAVLEIG
ncbi:ATP-binding cassette domain-containing protein [Bdellovibrio bacteriovorus]|uniref:ATP-binding cassette domain-containing protein n=1 Tax=Bdellovibrio bacteriovorus TaxID=959 RepID=UPI0035A57639